jgi:hypothetical protein
VEAAKGLDGGAADEGQVKLVHQVRHQVSFLSDRARSCLITRSLYPQDSPTSQSRNIND